MNRVKQALIKNIFLKKIKKRSIVHRRTLLGLVAFYDSRLIAVGNVGAFSSSTHEFRDPVASSSRQRVYCFAPAYFYCDSTLQFRAVTRVICWPPSGPL